MPQTLTRGELVKLVTRIMNADGTEEEVDAMINLLNCNVPDPSVSDLIFYPEEEMKPDELVDVALAYRPHGLTHNVRHESLKQVKPEK